MSEPTFANAFDRFDWLCSLLPEGFNWGDPLMPDALDHILRAARTSVPSRDAVIEECAKVYDEQADFYERLNPKKGSGSYMGKLAVSRQRDCARLIRALNTPPTKTTGDQ